MKIILDYCSEMQKYQLLMHWHQTNASSVGKKLFEGVAFANI